MQRNILDAARQYSTYGWLVVTLNGKVPPRGFVLKEFFSRCSQTEEEIASMFSIGVDNIGIVTGRGSNLVVVDVDDFVDAAFARLRFGDTPLMVHTGNRGFHLYYRYPQGADIGCRVRLWGRAIDLRANGGYVVAPPSHHPTTGRPYRWEVTPDEIDLNELPEFDPASLPTPKTPAPAKSKSTGSGGKNHQERGRRYLQQIQCVSGQAGHNTLYRACCRLIDLFGVSRDELRSLLTEWNQTNCLNAEGRPYPWSERELEHKISDAYEATRCRSAESEGR